MSFVKLAGQQGDIPTGQVVKSHRGEIPSASQWIRLRNDVISYNHLASLHRYQCLK